ncbi:host specificity factor TipJ family phage tail protein [Albimonas sp. CAU 1670]|uniref:host specificity factor TipJ family phage tail protein n=1 Tax=Albimonas sp. CAU 1670 TaxID=3032599 RepID=UPI0023DAA9EC|nr:host specificity factor TipJ family phage tail protein [Albimonas sp. CAU 1670]MDF2232167.1 host specificity factor TipJ family phage tail protein [Albimonas sp. CAU 1670]
MGAHLAYIEDPTAPERVEHHRIDGTVKAWLEGRFQEPFKGFVLRRSGQEEVPESDWGFVPDEDEIVFVFQPPQGLDPATIAAITAFAKSVLISIAVSVALTALTMLLFPAPDQPAFAQAEKPSPVFSVSYPQNTPRLHEALPILYGRLTYAPDVASMPYSFYSDNEHYVVVLLTVTCGECDVNAVYAGETNLDGLPDGAARWRAFGPGDHNRDHGVVGTKFGIWEDVVTSTDVRGLDLRSATADQTHVLGAEFVAPDTIRLHATGDAVDAFEVGGTVTVSGTTSNDAAFTIVSRNRAGSKTVLNVGSGVTDESFSETLLRTFDLGTASPRGARQQWTLEEEAPGGALGIATGDRARVVASGVDQYGTVESYNYYVDSEGGDGAGDGGLHQLRLKNLGGDLIGGGYANVSVYETDPPPTFDTSGVPRWLGPFRVAKPGQSIKKIELDLEFPSGLYEANTSTGELEATSVDLRFQIREIDADGNPVGEWETHDLTVATGDHLASGVPLNKAIRLSHAIEVGGGEWQVRGRRITAESTAAADQSRCVWAQLKGYRMLQASPVYGPVTLLAVEFKASAGFSQDAISRVRVAAHRRLAAIRTPWSGSEVGRSRSPVRAMYDMLCNPEYGLGLDPAVFLELAEIRAARALHAAAGLTFDHLVTDRSSAWDAVKLALQPALAKPLVVGGKVTIRQEGPKVARTLLFSPLNVRAGSLRIRFGFRSAGDPDGVKVVWRNPDSLAEQTALWPEDAVRPTELKIYGLTDGDAALDMAKVRWRQREGAQLLAEFEIENESRIVRSGERVGLSWPTFGWGDAAQVVEVDGLVLTLDRPVPDVGGNRWAALRDDRGRTIGPVQMSKTGPRQITLAADPGITLHALGGDRDPTHVAIGKGSGFLLDLVVDAVTRTERGRAKVTARRYLESAFDGTVYEELET